MAHNEEHTSELFLLEEAITVLFCEIDDAYTGSSNPDGHRYGSLQKPSDSEVLTLVLFQQPRGIESERSFLRARPPASSRTSSRGWSVSTSFLVAPPGARKLRRYLEPLRRAIVPESAGEPEASIIDSTLPEVLHPHAESGSRRASTEPLG